MLRSLVAPAEMVENEPIALRRNLTMESLEEALTNGDCLWIDAVNATEEEIAWLEHQLKLHTVVASDLRREDRRPSLLIYPEYMFLSLFQPLVRQQRIDAEEIHCIIGERYFITVRGESSSTVEQAYERAAQNPEYWRRGSPYFLYLTTQFVIDSYYPLLDRVSNQLNKLEESVMMNGGKISQQGVYRIKQQLINLRQMIAPQREVLSNVVGEERLTKSSDNRDLFRHLYERLLRIYDVIDSQRDLASNVLDLIESQEAAKLTNAVGRLTVFSMIFLPLTFIVGLFGLNFVTTEPELSIPLPGVIVFLLIICVTAMSAATMAWYFRKRGWL